NFEHVFMDGKSTDNTLQILDQYVGKYEHLHFYSQSDKGIYDAMNMGLERATGEWLFFLGVDDTFFNGEVLQNLFGNESLKGYDLLYGAIIHSGTKKKFFHEFDKERLSLMNMSHQGLFTHRRVFEKIGNFSLKYRTLADYEFNMRWFGDGSFKIKYVDQVITAYNEEGLSFTYFDKSFYKDKLKLVSKYLEIDERHAAFPAAANLVCNIQLKNRDFLNALKSAFKASRSSGKSFYVRRAFRQIINSVIS
ncbi:MAG: glycosyltransferase, partial [Leptolyngbya sp. SIO1D8]|nr:glycosyltransferase [Leptolyngbya sp. SIO1D8]